MAITRTQIARQLYQAGGGADFGAPDKAKDRASKGYGNVDASGKGGKAASKGFDQDKGPGEQSPEVYGASGQYNPERALEIAKEKGAFKKNKGFSIFDYTPTGIIKNLATSITNSPFVRNLNVIQRQAYLDNLDLDDPEQKEEYDRVMNELGGLGIDIIAGPETLTDTSLKQPMSLGAPKTTFKTTSSFDDDVSALGDPDVKKILGEGYQEYLDRFDPKDGPGDRGGGSFTDPCKGPNPPAYCFTGNTEEDETASTRNLAGLSGRIGGSLFDFIGLADGGRVAAADGGIMSLDREAFILGGIVKSAKKAVKSVTRGIKKIAKSPIGKAALLAAGGSYALGLGPFASGSTMFGGKLAGLGGAGFLKGPASNFFLKDAAGGFSLGNLSGKGILAGISAASLLPFLTGPEEEDEDEFDINAYYAGNRLNRNAQLYKRIMGTEFTAAEGGQAKEPVAKKTMPLLDMGGQEMDLRAEGGFVPIGRMEKADDVPARLSKNEFVFTADAVRNAGDGNVDKGAEVMYNMMKNLESGGDVSEESQGLEGARKMFQTSQRLGEVI